MDEAWWDAFTREMWVVADSRTGKHMSVGCYPTEARAAEQIEEWVARDARGKRQDVHHLIPYMVPLQVR